MTEEQRTYSTIEEIEPKNLWRIFQEISRIPRESGNEEGMRKYLIDFAQNHNLYHHVDTTGNVIIRCEATSGYENIPSLALQGHMDMVCVKEAWSTHDFTKDPIELLIDGDWITANGTTLGADNGIALAMILDLFTDSTAAHGPLEAICTVSEETGLEGAFGLDTSAIQSRIMLNLDSEEEGVFIIGCAGGVEVRGTYPRETTEVSSDYQKWNLSIEGLQGGHSGSEIGLQRANSISSIARILDAIAQQLPLRLVSIDGGTKRNVIPSYCKATYYIPTKDEELMHQICDEVIGHLTAEHTISDPSLRCICEKKDNCNQMALSQEQSASMIQSLLLIPHGVQRMSQTLVGLVETSTNLAIIQTKENLFEVTTSHRSSVLSSRDYAARLTVAAIEAACGGKASVENAYPAWQPDVSSPLAAFCAKAWKEYTGNEANITAIHAGLECGIINSLIPGMDSVSLGPNLHDVHSPKERLSISSTQKIAQFLRHVCTVIT